MSGPAVVLPARVPRPAVVLLARAPRPGSVKRGLEPSLGREGCAALQRLLIERASGWAVEAAGEGGVWLALDGEAAGALSPPRGVTTIAQPEGGPVARLAGVLEAVAADRDGPVLCASVDLPTLSPHHAWAAATDLAEGCAVTLGPASDGGVYLLGRATPDPGPLSEVLAGASRREIMARALAVARSDVGVGLLRSERELHTEADAAALLADPCGPEEVRAALRPRPAGSGG